MPFRTVAVGDRSLLGKWIWFDDLGGAVFASDTGVECKLSVRSVVRYTKSKKRSTVVKGCVALNQVDVFVGGPEWHKHALKLGVMEWEGRVIEAASIPPAFVLNGVDVNNKY